MLPSWKIFFLILFYLKNVCNVVLVSPIQHHKSAIIVYASLPSLASLPSYPIPLGHHRVPDGVRVLHSSFPPALHLTPDSACIYIYWCLFSPFVPLCPSPTVPISLFSTSVSPFLPWKLVHQYHFSRFQIYVLIHSLCFSFYDLLHSV